ncbi:methylesterase 10-like [Rutidosis leptorrhynchoides]|uniref:methylesterase 10-like n=1 Tax=Rutidosis leptorrhynchoides TaxID=125765 RepID=UPI003A98DED8
MPTPTKHLVLVHGLSHGAWCWYKVVCHLRSCGYHVTAVDLGGCGVHQSGVEEIATISDYIQPLINVLESLSAVNERVVLVGHSYGGLAISMAMERYSHIVSVGVFITSYMPNCRDPPALQIKQYFKSLKAERFMDCKFRLKNVSPMIVELGDDYMATMMYPNCQPEDLALAKMLVRPNGFFLEDMSKESLLTSEKYGSICRVYVICEGDQVMTEDFQKFIVKDSPPDEVKSFPEAGHMIMLSKYQDLSIYLQDVTTRYS